MTPATPQSVNKVPKDDVFNIGVKLIIFDGRGKILLLRACTSKDEGAYWDLPGGRIRRGDGIQQTLLRELYEETSFRVDEATLRLVGFELSDVRIPIDKDNVGLAFLIFTCRYDDTPEVRLSPEHSSYWWALPEEAFSVHPSGISADLLKKATKEYK